MLLVGSISRLMLSPFFSSTRRIIVAVPDLSCLTLLRILFCVPGPLFLSKVTDALLGFRKVTWAWKKYRPLTVISTVLFFGVKELLLHGWHIQTSSESEEENGNISVHSENLPTFAKF